MKVRRQSPERDGDRVVTLEDQEAIALLADGNAVLEPDQNDPPFALLDLLEENIAGASVFGPRSNDPKCLDRIVKTVFESGSRQTVVEGRHVRWFRSGPHLKQATKDRLFGGIATGARLFVQAHKVLVRYLGTRARRIYMSGSVTPAAMRERKLVDGRSANFFEHTHNFFQLSSAWYSYYEQLGRLRFTIVDTVGTALEEGRILCSDDAGGFSMFLHPAEAAQSKWWSGKQKLNFCFSVDLPKDWFGGKDDLHVRRNQAGKWMVRAVEHFAREDRKPTRDDLLQVAMDKYALTPNAAAEAYRSVAKKLGGRSGRPPARKQVNLSEINEIK